MRVGMNFALIDEALLVVMKKLDRVLDGDHVLFAFAVDFVQHGSERGGLTGTGRAGDEHEPARLVAEPLDDQRQAQGIKPFDFPGNRAEDRANCAALIEAIAAEARQVFQAKRKVKLKFSLEPWFRGTWGPVVGGGFVSGCRGGGQVQRGKFSWTAPPRPPFLGDGKVAAPHPDLFFS